MKECDVVWQDSLFVLGVICGDIMEQHHQKEEGHPQNVGKYCQLHVSDHTCTGKKKEALRGSSWC